MTTKLHQFKLSPFCDKVRRVLNMKGIDYELVNYTVKEFVAGKAKKLNPSNKLPVLEIDGKILSDSTDILEYIEQNYPNPALLPKTKTQQALGVIIEDWADESLFFFEVYFRFKHPSNSERWIEKALEDDSGLIRFLGGRNIKKMVGKQLDLQGIGRKSYEQIVTDLSRLLNSLETLLTENTFLLSHELTVVDISVFAQLNCVSLTDNGREIIDKFPKVADWMKRVNELTD